MSILKAPTVPNVGAESPGPEFAEVAVSPIRQKFALLILKRNLAVRDLPVSATVDIDWSIFGLATKAAAASQPREKDRQL